MNKEEAAKWLEQMGPEKAERVVFEHYHLKQHLCAQRLGVPTGCDDWVQRAIDRATHLRECETQLRILLDKGSAALQEAKWKTRHTECWNCRGTGRHSGGDECCVCRGTGAHAF
jgi:hypothetical protein